MKKIPGTGDASGSGSGLKVAPSAAVALKDLNIPQIAEVVIDLDYAQTKHERISGVCATLKGLALREAKRKLPHGRFMAWVKEQLPESHRNATRCMNLAKAFMGKLDSTVQFDVLTKDLHATLMQIQHRELDLKNPAVAAVAKWVNDRGAYQLMLELGDAPKGGKRDKKLVDETHSEGSAALAAQDIWNDLAHQILIHGIEEKTWADLPDLDLKNLRILVVDFLALLPKK